VRLLRGGRDQQTDRLDRMGLFVRSTDQALIPGGVAAVAQNISAGPRASTAGPCDTPATCRANGARKRIEEAFAWIKTIAGQAKTKFRLPPRSAGPAHWLRRRTT
jgi:hypothetical protein